MGENIPYVTARRNKKGEPRYYWQRRGHKLVRLPDDPIKRMEMAIRLNTAADQKTDIDKAWPEYSLGWVISKYKDSPSFTSLAPGTLKYYKRFLRDIEDLGGDMPFEEITRADIVDFVETYPTAHHTRQSAAVLRNLYNEAMYRGCAQQNLASDLRLESTPKRTQVWAEEDVSEWMEAADAHPKGMAMKLAFQLLLYTAQRPNDVLNMTWSQYDGEVIQVRQQKTKKLVAIPTHKDLRQALDLAKKYRTSTMIIENRHRAMSYSVFGRYFREINALANVRDLQARDLRRTAIVRLGEAGCTTPQIAAISGHTIDSTQQILETYLPRTLEMAKSAIQHLEAAQERKKNKSLTSLDKTVK